MKYTRLHKNKVDENKLEYITGNKWASNNGRKMKRFSEVIQRFLNIYKDRQQDSTRDALWTRCRSDDEVGKRTKRWAL